VAQDHFIRGKNAARGVTLTEILVVLVIIAVLAALLFPAVTFFREKGNQTACLAHMRQLAAIILQYSTDNNNRVLPAASGQTDLMNEETWYEILDTSGLLPGNPNNPLNTGKSLWGGDKKGIMACPSRFSPPYPYWIGAKHALHYSVNQHPGFFNRANTTSGSWPTLFQVAKPARTFLLAESSFVIAYPDGENLAYPHPRNGKDLKEGAGMNLVFYDGHSEYFKGKLPVLPGVDFTKIPYESIAPENSFPWY
jgi:prepilin-type N-terminal cleavage/methylation domain-containing protein